MGAVTASISQLADAWERHDYEQLLPFIVLREQPDGRVLPFWKPEVSGLVLDELDRRFEQRRQLRLDTAARAEGFRDFGHFLSAAGADPSAEMGAAYLRIVSTE